MRKRRLNVAWSMDKSPRSRPRLGLALGVWGLRTLGAMAAEDLPFWVSFAPRSEALLFCLAVGVGTTLLFGLLPAFLTSGVNVTEAMRASGGGASASRSRRRSLSALVVGEMALAQVLLVGAGLVLLSQRELVRVDPGYRADDVLLWENGGGAPMLARYDSVGSANLTIKIIAFGYSAFMVRDPNSVCSLTGTLYNATL